MRRLPNTAGVVKPAHVVSTGQSVPLLPHHHLLTAKAKITLKPIPRLQRNLYDKHNTAYHTTKIALS